MVVIVDYRMGNLGSIKNMLQRIGVEAIISSDVKALEDADKLILSGVGSFDEGMKNLRALHLIEALETQVLRNRKPILGICLGLHLLTKGSEEGRLPGLGWIDADVARFSFNGTGQNLKVPHMGWNQVEIASDHPLFCDLPLTARFYFAHSYHVRHVRLLNGRNILGKTFYGYPFVSALVMENVAAVQFHPEKSHQFGIRFLKNFVEKF